MNGGFRLYVVRFTEATRPPVSDGGFRREISPEEPFLALVQETPGWEDRLAMAFGTLPSRMVTAPLMSAPCFGGSYCLALSALRPLLGPLLRRFVDRRVSALEARVAALEVGAVSLIERVAASLKR